VAVAFGLGLGEAAIDDRAVAIDQLPPAVFAVW
jgi:hypothetical protein